MAFSWVTPSSRSRTSRSHTAAYGYETHSIVAIVEGRGQARGEVGMACMDLCTPHLILSQFTDTQAHIKALAKLAIFHPIEIIMPATSCETLGQPSRLYLQLRKELPNTPIVPIQRRVFNETKGLERIRTLVAEQFSSVVHLVTNKYYSLAATAALVKYLELVQSVIFTPRTLKIEFQVSEKSVMIDSTTARHLELLQNNQVANSPHSLYGIINACRTPGGARLLRMNILQPPCDVILINTRLDCVQELMANSELLYGLMNVLGQLPVDMESVIATLIQVPKNQNDRTLEQRINYIIFLKQTLSMLPAFVKVLEHATTEYFQAIRQTFQSPVYELLLEEIRKIIHDEARLTKGTTAMKLQRSFAVKQKINPILDIARQAYCEIQEDINEYVIGLSKDHNINFRLLESNTKGFYLQFVLPGKVCQLPELPNYFLNVHKTRNVVTFSTETLLHCEKRLNEILQEIQSISSLVISDLICEIRDKIGCLYNVSEAVSNLDLFYSLANYSLNTNRAVRPQFSTDYTAITMGRHPILDAISTESPVPNNLFMSNDTSISIITGPNMSGKTTLLKQIATLQVVAQLGCYVPAEAATFRIVDGIFSRIGNGDNLEGSASTFALEMTEMTYILENISHKSLVIIDELGRSTSIEEGTAISWAILEALMKHNAFILFATHYLFLTKMESMYPSVMNYKLETQECREEDLNQSGRPAEGELIRNGNFSLKLSYTHEFKRGVTDLEYYGLKLTKNSSYPEHVVENAMGLAKSIIERRQKNVKYDQDKGVGNRKSHYLLASHLRLLSIAVSQEQADPNSITLYLKNLQEEFGALNVSTC